MRNKTKTQVITAVATSAVAVAGLLVLASCQAIQKVSGTAADVTNTAGGGISSIGARLSGGRVSSDQIQNGLDATKTALLDKSEEEGFGQTLAIKLSKSPGYIKDADLTAYVQKVGLTVASVTDRDDIDFVFGVLNDNRVNAISGPHGYVFVTRGLLTMCRDESELAGVLAHEIGHVNKSHGLSAIKQAGLTRAGLKLGRSELNIAAMGDFASKAADLLIAGPYNRSQEDEADQLAVQYCQAAGYDPDGLARLLERVYAGQGGTPFSSHPSTVDRVGRIRAAIGQNKGGESLATRFAANVK